MKRMLCLVLTAVSLMSIYAAFAEAADDPVVVRVGDYTYSKSLVEFTMRSLADQNGVLWEVLSPEEKEMFRDAAVRQIIGIGVIESRLNELGRHDFSATEEEILRATAQSQYEQMWTTLYQYMQNNDIKVTETQVTQWLSEVGYSQDMFLESVKASERQFRMFDIYCGGVEITDDEVVAYYQEKYVRPDQERYENNVALYEEEMLKLGNAAFYVPEGYKYLKYIQVEYPEQLVKEAQPLLMRLSLTDENVVTAFNALALAAASVEELDELIPYREIYFEIKAENDAAGEAYLDKLREALPMAEAVLEKVKKGLAAGQSFELLISLYSGDDTFADPENPGTPFHPESPNWTGPMQEAALTLKETGDVSGPVVITDGMYILYYAGDMPGGAHELTDEEFEQVKQNAIYEAKLQKLTGLIDEWTQDYDIETHPELLDLN